MGMHRPAESQVATQFGVGCECDQCLIGRKRRPGKLRQFFGAVFVDLAGFQFQRAEGVWNWHTPFFNYELEVLDNRTGEHGH